MKAQSRVAWTVTAVVFVVPLALWAYATGNPVYYVVHDVPPGQVPYVLSKLVGLLALGVFWLQAMTALSRNNPALFGFSRVSVRAHRMLGVTLFLLAAAHGGLFVAAVSLREGRLAYAVLLPDFGSGYYKFYVSLGVIALALLLVGVIAGYLRRRGRLLRWLHRIWLVAFLLAFLHGVSIGTETRLGMMLYVYCFIGVSVVFAALTRIWFATRVHGERMHVAQGSSS